MKFSVASTFALFITSSMALSHVHGESIDSWTQFTGTTASQLNTNSPILGDGTTSSATNQGIYAELDQTYALGSVGDTLTLSAVVTLAGGVGPYSTDQFRFGIFDSNEQLDINGWLGYFVSNTGDTGWPQSSRLRERDDPNTYSFLSGAGATEIATAGASIGGNASFAAGVYNLSISYERDASDGLIISWGIIKDDNLYAVSGTFLDATPETYSFDRVGFTSFGGMDADLVSFSNIAIAIPEPSWSPALLLGVVFIALGRRRFSRK